MTERRKSPRGRTYIGAVIVFNNRASSVECLIRNMSDRGAKLVFADTVAVPEEFDLVIARQGREHRCRMVWRHTDETGIVFVRRGDQGPEVMLDLLDRLTQAEAENVALKRQLSAVAPSPA